MTVRFYFIVVFLVSYFSLTAQNRGDTVCIYGQIKDVRVGAMVEFIVNDYVLGRQVNHYADLDRQGRFKVQFTVRNVQDIFWRFSQDSLLRLIVSPRDSLQIMVDKKGVQFFGTSAKTNMDFSGLWCLYQRAFPNTVEQKALSLEPDQYFEFRVKQKDKQIKFLETYCDKVNCSTEFKEWFLADCEVSYFRELFAFGWKSNKYGVGSFKRMPPERSRKYKAAFMKLSWVDGAADLTQGTRLSTQSDNIPQHDKLVDPGNERYAMSSTYMYLINDLGNNTIRERIYSEKFLKSKIHFVMEERNTLSAKEVAFLEGIQKTSKTEKDIDSLKQDEYFAIVRRYKDRIVPKLLKMRVDFMISEMEKIDNPRTRELILTQRFTHYLEDGGDGEYFFKSIADKISDSSYVKAIAIEYNDVKKKAAKTDQLLLSELHGVALAKTDYEMSGDQLINGILLENRGKVIFIDFWGTWCAPCRADFAAMSPLKNSPPFDSVRFVYLCVRSQEKDWVSAIKKHNLKGTHYLVTEKQYIDLEKRFRINSYPTYFVIDKKRKLHAGIHVNDTKALTAKLTDLVSQE